MPVASATTVLAAVRAAKDLAAAGRSAWRWKFHGLDVLISVGNHVALRHDRYTDDGQVSSSIVLTLHYYSRSQHPLLIRGAFVHAKQGDNDVMLHPLRQYRDINDVAELAHWYADRERSEDPDWRKHCALEVRKRENEVGLALEQRLDPKCSLHSTIHFGATSGEVLRAGETEITVVPVTTTLGDEDLEGSAVESVKFSFWVKLPELRVPEEQGKYSLTTVMVDDLRPLLAHPGDVQLWEG